MTDYRLDGRTVLITGAGRGLGEGCVRGFVAAGANVIAVARTAAQVEALAAEFTQVEAWSMDVTDAAFYERVASLETLHVLVNNAGFNRPEAMEVVGDDTLDFMLNLNVRSVFKTAQAAVAAMRRAGGGAVINMSSQMGHVGSPNRTVYCMTKHAVEGLTKAMAVELAGDGIRVNAVAPTFVETELTRPMLAQPDFRALVDRSIPLGRLGQIDDVVNAVLYLASDLSRMTTGHSLLVDGGWTAQ